MSRITRLARSFVRHPKKHLRRDRSDEVRRSLEGTDFETLRRRFPESRWHKYLDLSVYVPVSVGICRELKLIGAPPQRILDIGCGTGLFLYCARYFGHDGIGTDIEATMMAEMAAMLGVERRVEAVQAFTPVSVPGPFDLITCMGTQFDRPQTGAWGCAEWAYFLRDLETRLTASGRVFLRINRGREATAAGRTYYDADVHRSLQHGHLHGIAYLFDRPKFAAAIRNLSA
jgi:SAM-dependent methyltransferase